MQRHLSDEQFTDAISGNLTEETRRHAQSCSTCRVELEQLLDGVERLRNWARAEADRPEWFWERRRHSIRSAVDKVAMAKFLRFAWAWAGVVGIVVLASSLLMRPRKGECHDDAGDPSGADCRAVEEARGIQAQAGGSSATAAVLTPSA